MIENDCLRTASTIPRSGNKSTIHGLCKSTLCTQHILIHIHVTLVLCSVSTGFFFVQAAEDTKLLRSLVVPLEEEIDMLKMKLNQAEERLSIYEGNVRYVSLSHLLSLSLSLFVYEFATCMFISQNVKSIVSFTFFLTAAAAVPAVQSCCDGRDA